MVPWRPSFHPKLFVKEHPRMKKQDYALDSETSKRLGIQITKYRKKLREEALVRHKQDALWQEVAIDDITVLGQRMNRGYFKG